MNSHDRMNSHVRSVRTQLDMDMDPNAGPPSIRQLAVDNMVRTRTYKQERRHERERRPVVFERTMDASFRDERQPRDNMLEVMTGDDRLLRREPTRLEQTAAAAADDDAAQAEANDDTAAESKPDIEWLLFGGMLTVAVIGIALIGHSIYKMNRVTK